MRYLEWKNRAGVHNAQWDFFRGWHNDFDVFRVGFKWEDYKTANMFLTVMGVTFWLVFRAYNLNVMTCRWEEWYHPCKTCGGRFGKHDETVEHPPF